MNINNNIIESLLCGHSLSNSAMQDIMHDIMNGKLSPEWLAGFIVAMRAKGMNHDELYAALNVMEKLVTPVQAKSTNIVDVVGTGGDGISTFNISTASMIVAASCGAKVAKHGNRSISSLSGSADVLEALGVNLAQNPEQIANNIDDIGLGFMFAPNHHPAMRNIANTRKMLGIRSFFNILGPLTNPANVKRMLLGVYDTAWLEPIARVLNKKGFEHAWIICADNGMDEISNTLNTVVFEIKNKQINEFIIKPKDYGFAVHDIHDIYCENSKHSAEIIQHILQGKLEYKNKNLQSCFDIVSINSAAVLYISGIANNLEHGIQLAKQSMLNGNAYAKLSDFIKYSN
jgi:anthranilate phosphoribosyltransferase